MKMRFKLAIRNILRQRGRSAVSLLMIAGAVIGLVTFRGFADSVLTTMRNLAINNNTGHLQVGLNKFWDLQSEKYKDQLIQDPSKLSEIIAKDPEVESVSGRLTFYGLISSGEKTISAKAIGFDPKQETAHARSLRITSGETLSNPSGLELIIGTGLQKKLQVPVGGSVTIVGYTLDGVVNAMEMKVVGIFSTANSEIDNNVFMLPLATTQALLDTQRVEVLTIHLKDDAPLLATQDRLQSLMTGIDPDLKIKTWYELGTLYRQAESFFNKQNRLIQIILLSLIFLGILNTVGMSVFERTGEIGTVRALGEQNRSVIFQFTLEGVLLGVLGAMIGVAAGCAIGALITSLGMTTDLPGSSAPLPLRINWVPWGYLQAVLTVIFGAGFATLYPAIRASKMEIVDALKKNI